jgi:hypothetical protein
MVSAEAVTGCGVERVNKAVKRGAEVHNHDVRPWVINDKRPASALCLLYLQQQKSPALSDASVSCHKQTFRRVRSNPSHEKQDDENDQDDTEDTDAAVTEAITITAEAATKAT